MTSGRAARGEPPRRVFIVTPPGLEGVCAAEVASLGLSAEPEPGGLSLETDAAGLYSLNLHLRTASRVLVRIAEFRARTFFELERHAARVPWGEFLAAGQPARLRVTSRKSKLYHQRAIEQRLRVAMGVPEAGVGGAGKEEDEGEGEQLFVVRFLHDRCVVSADSSGALLHRRGYRQAVAKAPLRETLAAAMLLSSGWAAEAPLLDPLCGSGTIVIEAALIARRIAPGIARADREPRAFAFQQWPSFDAAAFASAVERAREAVLPRSPVAIVGSDRDAGAIAAAEANAARAGLADGTEFAVRALSDAERPGGEGWLVTNPPYGVRVGESAPLRDLYAAIGRLARRAVPGGRLVMLSADRRLETQLRLPLREVLTTSNGGIPVRVMIGEVVRG